MTFAVLFMFCIHSGTEFLVISNHYQDTGRPVELYVTKHNRCLQY